MFLMLKCFSFLGDVRVMYVLCAFEQCLLNSSDWCQILDHDERLIFEYLSDIKVGKLTLTSCLFLFQICSLIIKKNNNTYLCEKVHFFTQVYLTQYVKNMFLYTGIFNKMSKKKNSFYLHRYI